MELGYHFGTGYPQEETAFNDDNLNQINKYIITIMTVIVHTSMESSIPEQLT